MRLSFAIVFAALLLAGAAPSQRFGRGEIRPGPWTPSKVPDGWVVHRTRHYEVQSQAGEEKAERLGEHMEVMNTVYRRMFPPGKGGAKRQVIKLLKDRENYLAYGAPAGSAAYYARMDREMVCYDTGKWSDEEEADGPITGKRSALERRLSRLDDIMKMDLLGCAAHEGWHQYFAWYTVSMTAPLPSWINEGMGDYFYTASPKEVRGRRIPAELGRLNDGRLMVLKAAIRADRYVPLEQLIRYTQHEFYANPSVCYAEGWAFCQFLLHSGNKKYEKVIPNFIKYVKNDSNYDDVRERAFRRIDMTELETEFKAWIEALAMPGSEEEGEGEGNEVGGSDGQ